jgi:hypothetical protein
MALHRSLLRSWVVGGVLGVCCAIALPALAQSKNRAPGFTRLDQGATVVVMSPDVELFSISAGGVVEPKADWTATAQQHLQSALQRSMSALNLAPRFLSEQDSDEFADVGALHAAVAQSIALHHMMGGSFKLPTKNDQLDWSLGEAVLPIREKLGSDYALFVWVRDSYASSERKAAMVALALLGVGLGGGVQTGYASLVDLRTGQVMWFNRLFRVSGDLRESAPAAETLKSLLTDFPASASK